MGHLTNRLLTSANSATTGIGYVQMDEVLAAVADKIKNFAVIYLVDSSEVPDFNTMYELYDPSTVMFFFRNKHIMIDLGTGNNNKINWALKDKQEFIDIVETVYRGARKGRGSAHCPTTLALPYTDSIAKVFSAHNAHFKQPIQLTSSTKTARSSVSEPYHDE
ncbi:hypothetical protein ACLB2K_033412 [Fragaria x ananassa]